MMARAPPSSSLASVPKGQRGIGSPGDPPAPPPPGQATALFYLLSLLQRAHDDRRSVDSLHTRKGTRPLTQTTQSGERRRFDKAPLDAGVENSLPVCLPCSCCFQSWKRQGLGWSDAGTRRTPAQCARPFNRVLGLSETCLRPDFAHLRPPLIH